MDIKDYIKPTTIIVIIALLIIGLYALTEVNYFSYKQVVEPKDINASVLVIPSIGVFEKINEFKNLVREYEGWTLTEFDDNIDTKLASLFTDMNVSASDVDPEVLQRLLINYKPVLRSVKQKYADASGNPLKDELGNVITYAAEDFKYIYDVLEFKSLVKLNVSVDLINLIIDSDFTNVRKNGY